MKVVYKGDLLEFDKLRLLSEFDWRRRTVSQSLDPLFNRNAETIMIDNKERIDEMNDILRDSYRIIDDPEILEQ